MISGYVVAAVSPFKEGRLDVEAFEKYMNYLVGSGVSGVVVCGSTGESLSLSLEEKIELVKTAYNVNKGKLTLLAGTIDAHTAACVEFMRNVEGYVDGFLSICPYYIKPSQEQIFNHFKTLSDSTEKGIVLYNNPGRVGTDIGYDVFLRLSELNNVIGIKECSSDLSRFSLWRAKVKQNFAILTGNDDSACGALGMGAHGVVSVSANVMPGLCAKMYQSYQNGDIERFSVIRDSLAPLHEMMFAEPSPAPAKYVLSKQGLMSEELRAPLSPISMQLRDRIDRFLEKIGM